VKVPALLHQNGIYVPEQRRRRKRKNVQAACKTAVAKAELYTHHLAMLNKARKHP
jgi:hypothetical protein